jgi:hypothetical protein
MGAIGLGLPVPEEPSIATRCAASLGWGGALALSVDYRILEVHFMIYYGITIAYLRVLK